MSIALKTASIAVLWWMMAAAHGQQPQPNAPRQKQYTIEQAVSERAQLHTMAFSGLAFLTGSFGADCFFPPGKVADFFGFQYMRDNDLNALGHNTDFLTRIANNIITRLTPKQLGQMVELANQQADTYDRFALQRMVLIKAFRENLSSGQRLNRDSVIAFTSRLYLLDADLSYHRALWYGQLAISLSESQKAAMTQLRFNDSGSWPVLPESLDKRSLSHRAHVLVMTYASEFFSWVAGNETADTYFCPERHGTYFGGFYLKDFPAMHNPGYNISTALTGDKGKAFLELLTPPQSDLLRQSIARHKVLMDQIVEIRRAISAEFRKGMQGDVPDRIKVYNLIQQYGQLDGELSYDYATCFSSINQSLTPLQRQQLKELRGLDIFPQGTYLFSDPMEVPEDINCSFLHVMSNSN